MNDHIHKLIEHNNRTHIVGVNKVLFEEKMDLFKDDIGSIKGVTIQSYFTNDGNYIGSTAYSPDFKDPLYYLNYYIV